MLERVYPEAIDRKLLDQPMYEFLQLQDDLGILTARYADVALSVDQR